jgi:hypothetical protein
MTQSEILSMTPDQLDRAIAEIFEKPEDITYEKLLAFRYDIVYSPGRWWEVERRYKKELMEQKVEWRPVKHPSIDISESYKLLEMLREKGFEYELIIRKEVSFCNWWDCEGENTLYNGWKEELMFTCPALPELIAKVFLLAMERWQVVSCDIGSARYIVTPYTPMPDAPDPPEVEE